MASIYKIHPAIGIARIGNSPDGFFAAPEMPGGPGLTLAPDGSEAPLTDYKDAQGRIKRQGPRFRVFEYAAVPGGPDAFVREVTPDVAAVEWSVQLANTKAAGAKILSQGPPKPRNPGTPTAQLEIRPTFRSIRGANQRQTEATTGVFKGNAVPLGELRTDAAGRLIVLGGAGRSESVPPGRPITNFANNPDWHDDVSDGPVDATLIFPDGRRERVTGGAWVVVAPPDFAPGVLGIATLHDVAVDAAIKRGWRVVPNRPSFTHDVLPILRRAAELRWVNQFALWNSYPRDWKALGDPANVTAIAQAHDLLMDVQESQSLNNFKYTDRQKSVLDLWVGGVFDADFESAVPPAETEAELLDRAALEATVGGGFFPGIEAGILMTNPQIYSEPSRLTRQPFTDGGAAITLGPGTLSQRMAVPWQADFLKCQGQWWPAQRPDQIFLKASDTQPTANWMDGITDHRDLSARFWKLGFVVPVRAGDGSVAQLEQERAADLPHANV